ncbi:hypothetical protein ILUMI_11909 [Ignelater luminosus]|uniref:Uncharacterized protein n=1 Tax=Ignelater luminosus TaxID=2038154 RepID=A0A8K0CV81_IGNLU|nr:hypothetical protein ILUMI_11909 [Ignelater luminosus]
MEDDVIEADTITLMPPNNEGSDKKDDVSRDKSDCIMSYIHLCDNAKLDQNDKFAKLRPLFDLLKKNFLKHAFAEEYHIMGGNGSLLRICYSLLSNRLIKVEEHGIRRRNFNRVFKKPKCYSQGANFDSVGIMDAYPAVLLWIYGIVLALIIFQAEKILQKITVRKRKNKNIY